MYWENGHRWYSADIQQDLLGTWVLECRWGRIGSRATGGQRFLTDTEGEAREIMETVKHRRLKRGYKLVCLDLV
ncbi:MAG: WGR domain-containing protein [Hahellaceae bacterium]|nr:WGR domain-containing protein [Hahellaceae bacterium]